MSCGEERWWWRWCPRKISGLQVVTKRLDLPGVPLKKKDHQPVAQKQLSELRSFKTLRFRTNPRQSFYSSSQPGIWIECLLESNVPPIKVSAHGSARAFEQKTTITSRKILTWFSSAIYRPGKQQLLIAITFQASVCEAYFQKKGKYSISDCNLYLPKLSQNRNSFFWHWFEDFGHFSYVMFTL